MNKKVFVVFSLFIVLIAIGALVWAQITLVSSRKSTAARVPALSELRSEIVRLLDCKATLEVPLGENPKDTLWGACRTQIESIFLLRTSTGAPLTSPNFQWRDQPIGVRGKCLRGTVFIESGPRDAKGDVEKWTPLFPHEVDLFKACR